VGQSGENYKTLWKTNLTHKTTIQLSLVNYFQRIIYYLINFYYFIMFIGEYKHTIDPKNRMTIPAKFQGQLSEGAIITKGLDNCLFVFTNEE
jgi:hypothetical protein